MDGRVEALAALGEKTIWEGCAAYRSAPGVTVGQRWFLTGSGYAGLSGVFLPAHGPIDRSATGFGPEARFEHLLGFAEGRPVACAAVFHGSAAAEVQHIVTSRGERRRGFGAAMTAAALAAARSRGCRTAVLTASPQGEGIYSALGFRTVGVVRRFAWDPPR